MWTLLLLTLLPPPLQAQTAPPEWHLSALPVLRLGGDEGTGPTEFANPYAAAVLGHRLVVLDGASQVLRLFDLASGTYLGAVGRKGHGPGEFQNAAYLQPLPGESLFVADLVQSRFTIFDSAGHPVRTVSLAAVNAKAPMMPLGRFPDGTVLAWALRLDAITAAGVQPMAATMFRASADGSRADSLATLPFATVNSAPFGNGWGYGPLLGAGQMTVAFAGPVAFLNSPTTFTLHSYSPSIGWRTVQEDRPLRRGTGQLADSLRAAAVAHGASAAYMASVPMADTLPAIGHLLGTASGLLFVVEAWSTDKAGRRQITVYSSQGRAVAHFGYPAALRPLAASDEVLVFTERDPETAPSILLYALSPH